MEHEKIMMLAQNVGNEKYAKFLMDEGWKYDAEEDALAGFERREKSASGALLTFEEFLLELRMEGSTSGAEQLYHVVCGLVKKGALSAYDLYQYARFRWCLKHPEAIAACEIGPKRWAVNTCDETVTEEWATLRLNSEFGFEASRIKLLGTPYYDATDWNFIRFRCGSYDWLMWNGELHKIYQ